MIQVSKYLMNVQEHVAIQHNKYIVMIYYICAVLTELPAFVQKLFAVSRNSIMQHVSG
jgi:hypothetical protein